MTRSTLDQRINQEGQQSMMKTQKEIRREFSAYFLHLKESMSRDGAGVGKFEEWERFVEYYIEEGSVPVEARKWKCPRFCEAELKEEIAS